MWHQEILQAMLVDAVLHWLLSIAYLSALG